jgi:hypothetical protein
MGPGQSINDDQLRCYNKEGKKIKVSIFKKSTACAHTHTHTHTHTYIYIGVQNKKQPNAVHHVICAE